MIHLRKLDPTEKLKKTISVKHDELTHPKIIWKDDGLAAELEDIISSRIVPDNWNNFV